jgi:hypothetical protein
MNGPPPNVARILGGNARRNLQETIKRQESEPYNGHCLVRGCAAL